MYVKNLWLKHYRSYNFLHLELKPGITIFLGSNGVGKTNIVEAIAYSSNLCSHRVFHDFPLVQYQHDQAEIRIQPVRGKLQLTLDITVNAQGRNSVRINRGPEVSLKKIYGIVKTVVFGPEDLSLVSADPQGRRSFLDRILTLFYPVYSKLKSDAEKILKQRNALLKSLGLCTASNTSPEKENLIRALEVWNINFIKNASHISWYRNQLVTRINELLREIYFNVSGSSKKAEVIYVSSLVDYLNGSVIGCDFTVGDFERCYGDVILKIQNAEINRGTSLIGPQRDDMGINLGGGPAKGYASHGESWSLALSLKLASYYILGGDGSKYADEPIVILDDVFAELDNDRRNKLAAMVGHVEQLLVTAAVPEDIPEVLRQDKNVSIVDVFSGKAIVRKT